MEFQHHVHALACLRELNNNRAYAEHAVGGSSRLIAEFSLENIEKVRILHDREMRRKRKAEPSVDYRSVGGNDAEGGGNDKGPNSHKKSQQKQKKQKKEKKTVAKEAAAATPSEPNVQRDNKRRREGPGKRRKRLKLEAMLSTNTNS